ncbi:MBL fold metallo-hydrolase [Cytobacillus purgationiresistens]|uniref:L-ascorbate metabolism protein UlaG (Beta-lactamase superfamily) n=1 Tax=Cytobacillus purgationiresistens TaxID=863449 RepID=A0ABU0AFN9_9BACI|nr:MBL fold metallo-hydrolase [Cytobacillus purgationiresistens]MDQ0269602.1 L-ascorbate metabolism protein UlaG (beta-lactamase superfamily) [Cytobacillus purgationiresistens]
MKLLILVVISAIVIFLILKYHPPLGGKSSAESQSRIQASPQFINGKFHNQIPTPMDYSIKDTADALIKTIKGTPNSRPRENFPIDSFDSNAFKENKEDQVIWFGHSTLLLKVNGVKLLIDPVFSDYASPVPFFGPKRYSDKLPAEIEDLPEIDAVIISHDHYDHLDYGSIRKLKGNVKQFIVPLGVAGHLTKWGVEPERIKELDWWDEEAVEGLTLISTPARHFSGRGGISSGGSTLWSSWVIVSDQTRVYYSGDSGYGPHFKEIGDQYGPFDITLIETGQYDEKWANIHMTPEESLQANLDVGGGLMIPIHWGAFTLALHTWTDPIERAKSAAEQLNVALATPRIGETVTIGATKYPSANWWK